MHKLGDFYTEVQMGPTGAPGPRWNYRKAAEWYEKAANAGLVVSMIQLALLYQSGAVTGGDPAFANRGIERDPQKAALWFEKAANAGDAPSMSKVGELYELGEGVTKDQRKAVEWYTKGATAGSPHAMYNLGYCYFAGQGVPKDKTLALQWLEKSARLRSPVRERMRSLISKNPGVRAANAAAIRGRERRRGFGDRKEFDDGNFRTCIPILTSADASR